MLERRPADLVSAAVDVGVPGDVSTSTGAVGRARRRRCQHRPTRSPHPAAVGVRPSARPPCLVPALERSAARRAEPGYELRSARKARTTMNHSKPHVVLPVSHIHGVGQRRPRQQEEAEDGQPPVVVGPAEHAREDPREEQRQPGRDQREEQDEAAHAGIIPPAGRCHAATPSPPIGSSGGAGSRRSAPGPPRPPRRRRRAAGRSPPAPPGRRRRRGTLPGRRAAVTGARGQDEHVAGRDAEGLALRPAQLQRRVASTTASTSCEVEWK